MSRKVDPEVVRAKLKAAGVNLNSWQSLEEAQASGVLSPEELVWFAGIEDEVHPAVWTREEAAQYLSISLPTLVRLVKKGEIPHVRIRRSVRFKKADLDKYLEARTTTEWTPHGHEEE